MATLIKRVQGFVRGQTSAGANGLALIADCVDHMFEHNDWTPLAWLINKSEKQDQSRIRAIAGAVTGGITMQTKGKQAQAQPSGMFIKMGDNAGYTDKMPILRALIEDGKSFRSGVVAEELLNRPPNAFDLGKYAKTVMNKLKKEECTINDLLNAFQPNEGGAIVEPNH